MSDKSPLDVSPALNYLLDIGKCVGTTFYQTLV